MLEVLYGIIVLTGPFRFAVIPGKGHTLRFRANTGTISHISVGMKADPETEMDQRRLGSTVAIKGRLDNERREGVNCNYQILCHTRVMNRFSSSLYPQYQAQKRAYNY